MATKVLIELLQEPLDLNGDKRVRPVPVGSRNHQWRQRKRVRRTKSGCRLTGADAVTFTINEVNTDRNSPHRFRLALVTVDGEDLAAGRRERCGLGAAGRAPSHAAAG